jgi:hypothetical protein
LNNYREKISVILIAFFMGIAITACADAGGGVQPPRQITSCPPGMVLICESRSQQEPSKGGAEEEIPQYDQCRCENVL